MGVAFCQNQCCCALVSDHLAKQLPHCSVLLCTKGPYQNCVAAVTPGKICSPCRCAVKQHQCLAALVRAIAFPLSSAALKTVLTADLCRCSYNWGDLCLKQVCSDATPMHSSTGVGTKHSLLPMLLCKTAGLCHCNSTYGDLPFIQVCRYTTLMQCSTCFGKNDVLLPMLLCKTAGLCHCNYTYQELLSHTGKQLSNTTALQHWIWLLVHTTA